MAIDSGKILDSESSPLELIQKHKREKNERKELNESVMNESSNISNLGDTFRQTVFNPGPTQRIDSHYKEQAKKAPIPSSAKKFNDSSNAFDGAYY